MNRRGTTLLELVVAVVLTALLVSLAGTILARAAYTLRDRSERFALEQAVRAATSALRQVLEPLGRDAAAGSDLVAVAGTGFVVRAVRGSGTVCGAAPGEVEVRAGSGWWSALRAPVAGRDSFLIAELGDGSPWRAVGLSGPPRVDHCPDGSPALALPVGSSTVFPDIGPGSPIRMFEPVEFRIYSSALTTWLGARAVATGEAVQPLAGPLEALGTGVRYFRADGSVAGSAAEVASVRLDLQALAEHAGGVGMARVPGNRADSVSLLVRLRGLP